MRYVRSEIKGDIRGATDLSIANRHPRRERYEVFQTWVEISRKGQTVDGRISGTRGGRAYFRDAAKVLSLHVRFGLYIQRGSE